MAQHLQQLNYPIKLSTRSRDKQALLEQAGLSTFLIDIDDPQAEFADFLTSDVLVINVTSKNRSAFEQLLSQIQHSSISHVLFISSTSVYQNLQRIVTEDEGAENPDSPLYQIEQLFRHCSDINCSILRLSGLIGPGRHPGRFFREGKTVSQKAAPVNLIHLDDCIAIITAIISQKQWNQTFNACADTHPDKQQFYTHAATLAGMPIPQFAESDISSYKVISNEKLKTTLGYTFIHPDLMKINF